MKFVNFAVFGVLLGSSFMGCGSHEEAQQAPTCSPLR